MADIRKWYGVLTTFNRVDKLISWEAYQDVDYTKTIELLCYDCFQKLSLGIRKLKRTERIYDQVQWVNNGHALPLYTTSCSHCQNILEIQTEYCCLDHQTRLPPYSREGLLKIMIEQITKDYTLCPYIVLQAHMFHNLQLDDIIKLISKSKEHISLFISTPAGILLNSMLEGRLT